MGQHTSIDEVPISMLGDDTAGAGKIYYDYIQVLTKVNGVNLQNKREWLAYYA